MSRSQVLLGSFLAIVVAAVWVQQSPGTPLTPAEVARYVERLETVSMPPAEKREALARLRAFGAADDGRPVYMLNVMRLRVAVQPQPGGPAFEGTPREANAYYERSVAPFMIARGAYPIFAATAAGANLFGQEPVRDHVDRVVVVRYPSRRAFLDMIADPAYGPLAPYKFMAMDLVLTPTRAEWVVPDLRLATAALAVVVFLAIGWMRATRLARTAR